MTLRSVRLLPILPGLIVLGGFALPAWSDAETGPLPHDLSPLGMFAGADWVVKLVMIGLLLASVLSWTVFVVKTLEFTRLSRRIRADLPALNNADSIRNLETGAFESDISRQMVELTRQELDKSADTWVPDSIKERVASSLSRQEAAFVRKLLEGTGLLATIGSTAPFVGLFGTVWGIMNSFIGISEARTTNLAVVAPGIAEALLATALGLVAAIPAVVIYNHFSRRIATLKAPVADMSAAIMRTLSRDLDRAAAPGGQAVRLRVEK